MKKLFLSLFSVTLLVTVILTGCSQGNNESSIKAGGTETVSVTDESTAENSSLSEKQVSSTEKASKSSDKNKTTESSVKGKTTTKETTSPTPKSNSVKKQTTAQRATTKMITTTKKKTTTSKATTTKKKTTTTKRASHCTNNNNHSLPCGDMGRWFGSKSEVKAYASSVMQSWNRKYENGEITWDEYVKNCPQGYECWSCSYCGKWTGNFKFDK